MSCLYNQHLKIKNMSVAHTAKQHPADTWVPCVCVCVCVCVVCVCCVLGREENVLNSESWSKR